ncbi:leucine-rich repeat domain-containing protein [Cytobacillus firmus]|uniref:leucine-rich repeat domain-containing protein n=1 Tax=Cytobacillus firmus TaxID=1399 RepID=UPI0024C1FC25|nr:leucine-rich repeat domain-containing protein [Cytobacillus firmus]WHY61520.1 leucine-rich repeat domain-containing protein [Cytobacillus firmus]
MKKRKSWLNIAVIMAIIFSLISPISQTQGLTTAAAMIDLADPVVEDGKVTLTWKTILSVQDQSPETYKIIKNDEVLDVEPTLLSNEILGENVVKTYEYMDHTAAEEQVYVYSIKGQQGDVELTSTAKTVSVYIEDNQSSQEESKEPVEQAAEKSAETAEPSEGSQEQPASEQDSVPAEEPANIDAEEVILDNPNLEKIIREQLPKPEGALLKEDLEKLTFLNVNDRFGDINSLKGLELAVNLKHLIIEDVSISDISVLGNVTNLTELKLNSLPIENIDSLLMLPLLEKVQIGNLEMDLSQSEVLRDLSHRGIHIEMLDDSKAFLLNVYRITESSAQVSWGMYGSGKVDQYTLSVNGEVIATLGGDVYEYHLTGLKSSSTYNVKVSALGAGSVMAENEFSFNTLASPLGEKVTISDSNLEAAIKEELGLDRELHTSDMERLTALFAPGMEIESLDGLEHAVNLDHLVIYDNNIEDLAPLKSLTKLIILDIGDNPVSDSSIFKNLTKLANLDLSYTEFEDFTFLKELLGLQAVYLYGNLQIEDHAPSIEVLEYLRSKGVEVNYDFDENVNMEIYTDFVNESKIGISWDYWTEDEEDYSYPDQYVLSVDGVEKETLGETNSEIFTGLKPETGYSFKVKAYQEGKLIGKAALTVSTASLPTGETIHFPDKKLEKALKERLGLDRDIQESDMHSLESIDLSSAGITDLSGLEKAVNLEDLSLWDNNIKDISPLGGLTHLMSLDLDGNPITDLKPLKGLSNLFALFLSNTGIKDFSSLNDLSGLMYLTLSNNGIESIPDLSGLKNLEILELSSNNITSLKGLEGLSNLMMLTIESNPVTDFSALSKMKLLYLDASYTDMQNLKWAADLTQLEGLAVAGNNLSDISPLKNLKNLSMLMANDNQISDIGVLLELERLEYVTLFNNEGLDLADGSEAMKIIEQLLAKGVFVEYENIEEGMLYFDSINSTSSTIDVSWIYEGEEEIEEYQLYLDGELIGSADPSEPIYTFEGLDPGKEYEIMVEAWSGEGIIDYGFAYVWTLSEDLNFTDVSTTDSSIEAYWEYTGDEELSGYNVYLDGEFLEFVDAETHDYTFEELMPRTSYTLALEAVNTEESVVSYTSTDVQTESDSAVKFMDVTAAENSIEASWEYKGAEIDEYSLYLDGELAATLDPEESFHEFTGLEEATEYKISIEAILEGEVVASDSLLISTEEAGEEDGGTIPGKNPGKGATPDKDKGKPGSPAKNQNIKDNKPAKQAVKNTKSGKKLPNTATNMYNMLALGLTLLFAGSMLMLWHSRRKKLV